MAVEPCGVLTTAHTLLRVILTSSTEGKGPDMKEEMWSLPFVRSPNQGPLTEGLGVWMVVTEVGDTQGCSQPGVVQICESRTA